MKKVLIASGVAVLALAMVVSAQGYSFNTNLTVGSTGPDVVALQTWLMAQGYNIPAISSGAAAKGYFGSQTKSAVVAYQAAHGIPNTGFFGPLTRAAVNASGGAVAANCPAGYTCTSNNPVPVAVNCPVGFTCTPVGGGTVIGGQTGITTPGVQGLLSVTQGPVSSTVLNVGQTKAPLLTVRATAQYSDVAIQSIQLDLGSNTSIYNKIFSTLYVTDGTNVLATLPLAGNAVQSGSDYIVGLGGFSIIVPKGTYKDIVIKADVFSSIDSLYTTGARVPTVANALETLNGTAVAGWTIGLGALSVRGVDGAGINLYGPSSAFTQGFTINSSLVDNAQPNLSLDPASPNTANIPVNDTTNGQYLGLPVLIFDVNAQNDTLHLHEVKVGIQTTQSAAVGSVSAAYLYNGSTLVTSAAVSAGVADFTNITDGTNGATIPVNTTVPYTVKVDVTGLTAGTLAVKAMVATSSYAVSTIYNSQDGSVATVGSATGYTQTVASAGPLFTLASAPTITKTVSSDNSLNTLGTYTATFNVNVLAVGTDIDLGLPASTTGAAFGSSSLASTVNASIYQNGAATSSQFVTPNYSQPNGTTLSGTNNFTLSRNQSVTIPVLYTFQILNAGSRTYAVQLNGIYWEKGAAGGALQLANFMSGLTDWRSSSI